ncbi:MAG: hypothetical protein AAF688_00895, partial [Bacteroidota bacterium]
MKHVLITLTLFLFVVKQLNAQSESLSELDSIYALQAVFYKQKKYDSIITLAEGAERIALKNSQDSIIMARITAYIGYANNKY